MPVRRSERPSERINPYQRRRPSMAAAVLSPPMHNWQGMDLNTPSGGGWQQHHHHHHLQHFQTAPSSLTDFPPSMMATSMSIQPQHATPVSTQVSHNRRPSTSHTQPTDGPWTTEMDNVLMDAQARGLKWEQISQQFFPKKSANACRKRYGRAKEEKRATDWDDHRMHRVIAAYNKEGVREQMWGLLARETGEKWQDIERLCYSQGLVKMLRGRGNLRTRSRGVSASHTLNDSRYHSPNEDYDPREDSGVGLGLLGGHEHHSAPAVQAATTSRAPLDTILRSTHQYPYSH